MGRYIHKIALSINRIVAVAKAQVKVRYRDYRDGLQRIMSLSCDELVRRFALHVLPKGFMRVRYYGFLANPVRQERLQQIRAALQSPAPVKEKTKITEPPACPQCGEHHWCFIGTMVRWFWQPG
ncbi:transposase [Aliikangiella sp. IMCC44632]